MKKTELLSPAGNMDSLKAAVAAGCDAVYLGMSTYSARAFAGNFTNEELLEAVKYCHTRNVRVYVTVNTMLFETEIEQAAKQIDFLYHADVDALLIQDLGVFHYVRTCYPDFEIHCSTQMHIHNLAGIRFMQKEGASRAVIARETPIELIRQACQTGMDIEVFVYGAICISYSGQCLMSESIKNRSANRGMCAQCCRLKYYPEEGKNFREGEYILSPKDLNVIDRLPEILDAGVSSLKIEGRMKRPEYVWLVTKTFREAIDAYYDGKTYHTDPKRQKDLLLMFNRGFSEGHLFGDNVKERMSQYRPNHQGVRIGTVLQYAKGKVQVKLTDELHQHDGLRILNEPYDTGLTAVRIYKNEKLVSHASAGDTVWLDCASKPHPKKGQPLQKTSDTELIGEIDQQIMQIRKSPVRMEYEGSIGKPFIVRLTDDRGNCTEYASEQICEKAMKAPLSRERIVSALQKTDTYPYEIIGISGNAEGIFLPVSVLNEVRRNVFEQMEQMRAVLHPDRTEKKEYRFELKKPEPVPYHLILENAKQEYEDALCVKEGDGMTLVADENLDDVKTLENTVLSEVGDFAMDLHHCIGGMTLNIANSYAAAYVLSQSGVDSLIFSSEISEEQIRQTLEAFKSRYGFAPATFRLVYGRRKLMYIKDRFVSDDCASIADYHGNIHQLVYNNWYTEILESEPFRSENQYCTGSYLILRDSADIEKEIVKEAYEEVHGRI